MELIKFDFLSRGLWCIIIFVIKCKNYVIIV